MPRTSSDDLTRLEVNLQAESISMSSSQVNSSAQELLNLSKQILSTLEKFKV